MEFTPSGRAVLMEAKLKHLEFLQGVIDRMGSNSFRIKGWSVVLVSALLILVAREDAGELIPVGLVPVLVSWGLDAYFLRQERLYRALYDHVRVLEPSEIDFSMDTTHLTGKRSTYLSTFLSKTLMPFYFAVAIAVLVLTIII